MTNTEFNEQIVQPTIEKIHKLGATKGKEYGAEKNCFENFTTEAEELGMLPDKILWVYMSKHMRSLKFYLREHKVLSEPIDERVDDVIMYLLLLKGLWRDMATESGTKHVEGCPARHIERCTCGTASRNFPKESIPTGLKPGDQWDSRDGTYHYVTILHFPCVEGDIVEYKRNDNGVVAYLGRNEFRNRYNFVSSPSK